MKIKVNEINEEIINLKNNGISVGEVCDGWHTFDELYEYRKVYNALLFNEWAKNGKVKVSKSKRHHDGEQCFGRIGELFIVVAELPTGQISNHYKIEDWELFDIPEYEISPVVYDGHSSKDALNRMYDKLKEKNNDWL